MVSIVRTHYIKNSRFGPKTGGLNKTTEVLIVNHYCSIADTVGLSAS